MPSRRDRAELVIAQQFGCQHPRDGPAEPKRLGVQEHDSLARGGVGALDPVGDKADHGFIDDHLTIGAELDDQSAKQLIVGRQQRYRRYRAQARAQIAQLDLQRGRLFARGDQNKCCILARQVEQVEQRPLVEGR